MSVCNRDCFHCPYPDCIVDDTSLAEWQVSQAMDLAVQQGCGEPFRRRRNRSAASLERKKVMEWWHYQRNRGSILEKKRVYRQTHKEKEKAYRRAYYLSHKEEDRLRTLAYRRLHRERVNELQRAYYQAHKDEINARRREARRLKKQQKEQETAST